MSLESLIHTYGYVILFVGTFLEGETALVAAGFAADRGYLSLPVVVWVAALGSFFGDQMWFQIGRSKGRQMLAARPQWQGRAAKVERMLARHEMGVLIGFRFLYGLRMITPVVIGATQFSQLRFVLLNAIGSIVWALTIATAGYAFGSAMELILKDIRRYELTVLLVVASVGALVWLWHLIRSRRRLR